MRIDANFVLAVAMLALGNEALGQTYITPSTPGWAFATETPTGSGTFVSGPGTTPSGSPGSIQLTVGAPGGELFATQQFGGVALSQIAGLAYNTYVVSSAIPEAANMQFDFDPGVPLPPPLTPYQGRAVFTPALLNPLVTVGAWQTWNPMTQKAWWGSGTPAQRLLAQKCTQAAPCTWAQIVGFFPKARIAAGGVYGFKVGNSNSAAAVSVDSFSMGTAGAAGPVTTYLFSPAAPVAAVAIPALSAATLLTLVLAIGGAAWLYRSWAVAGG